MEESSGKGSSHGQRREESRVEIHQGRRDREFSEGVDTHSFLHYRGNGGGSIPRPVPGGQGIGSGASRSAPRSIPNRGADSRERGRQEPDVQWTHRHRSHSHGLAPFRMGPVVGGRKGRWG